MLPTLFKVGPVEIKSFSVMMMIALLVGVLLSTRRARARGIDPQRVVDSAVWMVLAGVLGARVMFVAQEWSYFAKHPEHLWSLRFEGLTSFGGFLFGFFALALWCKIQKIALTTMLDIFAIPFLIANAIGRVGCLLNGCCYGVQCGPPLGVHFDGLLTLHHPAQIYESILCLTGAAILLKIERSRSLASGQIFGFAMISLGISRFIYEFWRAGTVDEVNRGLASSTRIDGLPITQAQVVAMLIALVGVSIAVLRRRSAPLPAPAQSDLAN